VEEAMIEKWTRPAGWPAMTRDAAKAALCAPGAPFEMEVVTIEGVPTRVWKNALPTLAALAEHTKAFGEREFVVFNDERMTYADWYRAVAALAAALQELGVTKGDRIALAMRNLPEWPVAFFAGAVIGAIVVPLNAWWTGEELAFGMADSGASVLICDAERWERMALHKGEMSDLQHVLVTRGGSDLAAPARALEAIIGAPKNYAGLPETPLPDVAIEPDDAATIFYNIAARRSASRTRGQSRSCCGPDVPRNRMFGVDDSHYSGRKQNRLHAQMGHRKGV
jgi:long-chain acyl-CoA synthetase